jgi:AcrR family transcriptional regulator
VAALAVRVDRAADAGPVAGDAAVADAVAVPVEGTDSGPDAAPTGLASCAVDRWSTACRNSRTKSGGRLTITLPPPLSATTSARLIREPHPRSSASATKAASPFRNRRTVLSSTPTTAGSQPDDTMTNFPYPTERSSCTAGGRIVSTQIARLGGRDPEAFFAAAYGLLSERGRGGLTIAALCDRLGVTKGSFYHHFDGMPGFVAAFAERWESHFVNHFKALGAESDMRRRLEAAVNGASPCMSPGVRAMLAWAPTNPAIADAVLAVERNLKELSAGTFAAMAEDEDTGQVLGPMVNSMPMGIQHRPRGFPPERFLLWAAELYRATGVGSGLLRVGGRPHLKVHSWRRLDPVSTPPTPAFGLPQSAGHSAADAVWSQLGRRAGTRDRYFVAAGELLAEQGSGGLTVAALVERLELTKGSFHHHFGVMPSFIEQLAREWEQAEMARIDECLAERNPWRRAGLLHSDLLVGPTRVDAAWRTWGHSNVVVAAALRRVDEHGERTLALTLAQLLDTSDELLRAEMTMAMSLGLHQWHPPLDRALIARVAIEWMRRLVGLNAEVRMESDVPRLAFSRA